MRVLILKMLGLLLLLFTVATFAATPTKAKPISYSIQGITGKPLKNIQARLDQNEAALGGKYTAETLRRFRHHLAEDVQNAIQPYGYFQSQVATSLKKTAPKQWLITINVTPGPRLKFTRLLLKITGEGASDPEFIRLKQHFPVKVGDFFESEQYSAAKSDLFSIAANRGYFHAGLKKNQLIINLNNYTSTVILHFTTGPRFYFGNTVFSKTPFYESFLRRYLDYKAGQPYLARKLTTTRENLANANYFQEVVIIPKAKDALNLHIPIEIKLKPAARKQYTFGLGYGTDTGIRGMVGMTYNWVNGWGHRFDMLARGSFINSEVAAHYTIPGKHPARDQYIISSGLVRESFDTGQSNSARLGVAYQTIVRGWQLSANLIYLDEHSHFPTLPGNPTVNANLVYPSLIAQRRVADDQLNPSRGYSVLFGLAGASDKVLSRTTFFQVRTNFKALYTLFHRLRVIVRADGGYTDIKEIQNLPLTLQLYAGGSESIRGYVFNQFGPGRFMLTGTFELQQRLFGNLYATGFIDAGNATNNFYFNQLNVGVGPGLAYSSPIGLLEISFAKAITAPHKPWLIQFTMGPIV